MSAPLAFGPFNVLFEKGAAPVPGYLRLLHPTLDDLPVLQQLRDAHAHGKSSSESYLQTMLKEANWRPQLVAATAMLLAGSSATCIVSLWAALDRPCWTSPQLAAVASRVDPAFFVNARLRIERRCPMEIADVAKLDWAARHSAMGPNSISSHSAKVMASLVALCEQSPETMSWLRLIIEDEGVREFLAGDTDQGGVIAVSWLANVEKLCGAL